MTTSKLRKDAANLARECRAMKRKGDWSIRQWNHQVRIAIRNYMKNITRFHQANDEGGNHGKRT